MSSSSACGASRARRESQCCTVRMAVPSPTPAALTPLPDSVSSHTREAFRRDLDQVAEIARSAEGKRALDLSSHLGKYVAAVARQRGNTRRGGELIKATARRLRESLSAVEDGDASGDVEGELPALVAHLSRAAARAGFSMEHTQATASVGGVLFYRLLALGVVLSVQVQAHDVRVRSRSAAGDAHAGDLPSPHPCIPRGVLHQAATVRIETCTGASSTGEEATLLTWALRRGEYELLQHRLVHLAQLATAGARGTSNLALQAAVGEAGSLLDVHPGQADLDSALAVSVGHAPARSMPLSAVAQLATRFRGSLGQWARARKLRQALREKGRAGAMEEEGEAEEEEATADLPGMDGVRVSGRASALSHEEWTSFLGRAASLEAWGRRFSPPTPTVALFVGAGGGGGGRPAVRVHALPSFVAAHHAVAALRGLWAATEEEPVTAAWRAVQAADEEAMAVLCTQAQRTPAQRADGEGEGERGGGGDAGAGNGEAAEEEEEAAQGQPPLHVHVWDSLRIALKEPVPPQGNGSGSGGEDASADVVAPHTVDGAIGRSSAAMGCVAASFGEATAFLGPGGRPAPAGPVSSRRSTAQPRETALWPTTHTVTSCARAAGAATLLSSSVDAEAGATRQWRAVGDVVLPMTRDAGTGVALVASMARQSALFSFALASIAPSEECQWYGEVPSPAELAALHSRDGLVRASQCQQLSQTLLPADFALSSALPVPVLAPHVHYAPCSSIVVHARVVDTLFPERRRAAGSTAPPGCVRVHIYFPLEASDRRVVVRAWFGEHEGGREEEMSEFSSEAATQLFQRCGLAVPLLLHALVAGAAAGEAGEAAESAPPQKRART